MDNEIFYSFYFNGYRIEGVRRKEDDLMLYCIGEDGSRAGICFSRLLNVSGREPIRGAVILYIKYERNRLGYQEVQIMYQDGVEPSEIIAFDVLAGELIGGKKELVMSKNFRIDTRPKAEDFNMACFLSEGAAGEKGNP